MMTGTADPDVTGNPAVRQDYHALIRHDVLDLVPNRAGRVLDVGGGIGASAAHLKQTGQATLAVVVDLVANACLPEIDAAYDGNLENPALLARIAAEQGPFDTILCFDVLEHLVDPWVVMDRLVAMLAPGGVVVASIPNVRNYRMVLPLAFRGRWQLADSGLLDRTHLRWFVRDSAEALIRDPGLRIEKTVGVLGRRLDKIFNLVTFGLFRDLLTIQYYIRGRKP
jgi:2-polyprenyl-3-methyl-5-hydroxy-6-metoxy-1,4-benzoquinol methylase